MSAPHDASQRLQHLAQILAQSKPARTAIDRVDADAADVLLGSVPIERIRRVTSELQHGANNDNDEIDAVTMRLLLDDYATAVAQLRAVVRLADQRVENAKMSIEEARRFVRQQLKRAELAAAAACGPAERVDDKK